MSIYWRNGWAYARKQVKGVDRRVPLGTRSKREAEAAHARFLIDIENEGSIPSSKIATSFQAAVENFQEHHFPTLKPASRIRYMQSLITLTPHFGNRTLQEITKAEIGEFVSDRRRTGSKKKGRIKDPTIIRDLQCLSSVFTVAADFDLCDHNPVAAYLKTHQRRKTLVNSAPRTRRLSHVEERLVLDAALARAADPKAIRRQEKAMIAAALALYIDLGFRAQELLNAKRAWLNLARNEITVPGEFTKTGKPRTIPLFPRARRILAMLPTNKHTDLLLWRCAAGKKFSDLNKTFQTIAAGVGVTDVEVHDLRRTCGCRLLQDHRMTMPEVSKWLGHASVEQTESTYAFLEVESLHDAIGGRVHEKTARLYLAEMFDVQFADLVGTNVGTLQIGTVETKGENGKGQITHNP